MDRTWDHVELMVLARPAGFDMHIPKAGLPAPSEAGMQRAIGVPKGTLRHYRRRVRGESCLHVREYDDHFEVHWDRHDPRRRPLAHWWTDVRGGKVTLPATVAGLACLGLLFV